MSDITPGSPDLTIWMETDGRWSCQGHFWPSKAAALNAAKRAGYVEIARGPGWVQVAKDVRT